MPVCTEVNLKVPCRVLDLYVEVYVSFNLTHMHIKVAVTRQDGLQCANKDKEEVCKLVNKDVNNAGFKVH